MQTSLGPQTITLPSFRGEWVGSKPYSKTFSPAVFDHLQYSKMEGEGIGFLITRSAAQVSQLVTCHAYIYSHAMERTKLVLCTTYKDKTTESNIKSTKKI